MEKSDQQIFEEICKKVEEAFAESNTQDQLNEALAEIWREYGLAGRLMPCSVAKGFSD